MIRIRLNKGITENDLSETYDFTKIVDQNRTWFKKSLGSYEIQIKPGYPSNVRLKDWDDNRTPWILFKFLLLLEAKLDYSGKIKITDQGKYKILDTKDTLNLINELSKYTDLGNRLSMWYKNYLKGTFKIDL